tara:strand:- start:63 stop:1190 length:1128 start_codon:yes stop_codon:yes gene_type:complete
MVDLFVETSTVAKLYRALEDRTVDSPRPHLGASVIGRPCARELWYSFRWGTESDFNGRLLRLFRRGHQEEGPLVEDLRNAGVTVLDADPRTGKQFQFSVLGGHVGGSMDGAGQGFVESNKWHLLEFKTANDKSFKQISKQKVRKAKPEHWAQMQLYMHWSGTNKETRLERAMYIVVNKNTDEIYLERIKYDAKEARKYEDRAKSVVESPVPLERISEDPSWYQCKFCSAAKICHQKALPVVSCRTCTHATPELDGDGRWSCSKHNTDLNDAAQRAACGQHVYIPDLVTVGEYVGGNEEENYAEYKLPDGRKFRNGGTGRNAYSSVELRALDVSLIADKGVEDIRESFGALVVDLPDLKSDTYPAGHSFYNDDIPF